MASPHSLPAMLTSTPRPSLLPFADKPLSSFYNTTNHNSLLEPEDKEGLDDGEQDDALNLVVTPKKKRHKVTDTRITPRTVSRLLGEQHLSSMAELHKHLTNGQHFAPFAPGGLPKHLAELPRPPFPGLMHPAAAPDFPFPPFPFNPNHHPLNRPRDLSPPAERPRSASPPRDTRPPPPLLHPAMLAAQSPELGFDRPVSRTSSDDLPRGGGGYSSASEGQTPFSLASMSGQSKTFFTFVFSFF